MYKWVMSGLICLACVLAVGLLATGLPEKEESAGGENTKFTVPERAVDAVASEMLYSNNCISCHGDKLQGGMGPELATVGGTLTKEQIYKKIEAGGGGMPGFEDRLTEDEIINLTTWLAAMK